ncbi:hypothetical protein GCM10007981_11650 [Thermocladium modestius]|uniref:VapC9 PIN-like domain-containing protein n=1 Tax=Thermocladium modestius TaxID=62609 RepID=A0A830GX77_9CREN|nr:PIN domain-containing protein [Thermocladium modestius]GGP21122.1 hypothetical protein GCM10007981_11650 [Thermocladium modestius]
MGKRYLIKIPLVLFDTSALLLSFREGINLLNRVSEIVDGTYVPVVTRAVLEELDKLARYGSPRMRHSVESIKSIINDNFAVADVGGDADESIMKFSANHKCVVVTCDMELKHKLERMGVEVIYFRKSSRRFESDF